MIDNPLTIDVYDKAFAWLGVIADPVEVSGSVVYNGLSSFEITIRATDPMVEDVLANGTRISITYRGITIFSGPIRQVSGSLLPNQDLKFRADSDWRILQNTVAWVNPIGSLTAANLSVAGSYDPDALGQAWLPGGGSDQGTSGTTIGQYPQLLWPNGSSVWGGLLVRYTEDAVKWLIQANAADRLGWPLTIPASSGRGIDYGVGSGNTLPLVRMNTVEEVVQPLLSDAGLGLRVRQERRSSTITVDVFTPSTWSAPLTVASGIVTDGQWQTAPPPVTRYVIGGPGDMAARVYWSAVDAADEATYGDKVELFRDATNVQLTWPDGLADNLKVAKYYLARSDVTAANKTTFRNTQTAISTQYLKDAAPLTGVQATLSETESFYFGGTDGVQLGDLVSIAASSGAIFTNRITEAKFTLTASEFKVEPVVGSKSDDPNVQLAKAIKTLANAQRRITSTR